MLFYYPLIRFFSTLVAITLSTMYPLFTLTNNSASEKKKMTLSDETIEGLRITGMQFNVLYQ